MAGQVIKLPDIKAGERRQLMGPEIGTSFDYGQRLFSYFGSGDVFDYGEWKARDMSTMLVRDGTAAALESVLTLPIRQAKWAIEPAKSDNGEAEFIHSVLNEPHWKGGMEFPMQEIIGQMTSAQIYRKAFFEKVFHVRPTDGRVTYSKLAFRPTATCEVKRNEKTAAFDGFRQQVWLFGGQDRLKKQRVPGYVDIPKIRSFVYIHGKHREPLIGTSELDLSYWCYQTKVKLLFLWYNYLEAQSLPKVITYGQDQPEANSRADDVASMRQSGVVGWVRPADSSKSFDLLETNGEGADQFNAALTFLESWQTSSVLAGFMGLASAATGGRGSFALSSDQSDFFLMSRQAITAEMQEDITHQVVADLVRLNFGSDAAFPKFVFGPLVDQGVQSITAIFQALAVAPALQVPAEILDLITIRLASVLQLDVNQVHQAVQAGAQQRAAQAQAQVGQQIGNKAAGQLGSLAGGVAAAANIAKASGNVGQVPKPSSGGQPYIPPLLPPNVPLPNTGAGGAPPPG